MINSVKDNIYKNNLFTKKSKILLAVSGGADSIFLLFVLKDLGYDIQIAHCNFNLRDVESDQDEQFVKDIADKYSIRCYVRSFDTLKFAEENKISIQMAARQLRYDWFEELLVENNFSCIATGHHQDDSIETFLINLIRGSGISGLCGIQMINNKIVRPLLSLKRNQIEYFLTKQNIKYRNDSSNSDIKYLRNNIRHQLIPLLKEINPKIQETISNEINMLNGINNIFKEKVNDIRKSIMIKREELFIIKISDLLNISNLEVILYELLRPFGSFQVKQIINSLRLQSGKQFFSNTHYILIDRECLIISQKKETNNKEIKIFRTDHEISKPLYMKLSETFDLSIVNDPLFAKFDLNKLTFPLLLRKWKNGDKFIPLGMNNFKKVSDFFVDEKYTLNEKKEQWILCSKENIIWIVGKRIDDRYKIASNTKITYIAQLLKNK
jgi:tRNA(Ile)-lysidine synthase